MTIKFILLVNKQGQTRLAKYFSEFLGTVRAYVCLRMRVRLRMRMRVRACVRAYVCLCACVCVGVCADVNGRV